MRKQIAALFMALTVAAGGLSLTACGGKYSEWEEVKAATCTETGLRRRENRETGEYEQETIPMLGHDFNVNNVCRRCTYTIEPTEGLAYHLVSGGYAVAYGSATATEVVVPAYYEYDKVVAVYAEGFRFTSTPDEEGHGVMAPIVSVWLPDGIATIGERAFCGCEDLTEVTLPQTLTEIGAQAFYECEDLTTVNTPRDLTAIGQSAFEGCSDLRSAPIDGQVNSIGSRAFAECSALTALRMNAAIEALEERVFEGCASLKSVTVGIGVKRIGSYAFHDCSGLKEVILYRTVQSIAVGAFEGCENLTAFRYNGTVDNWNSVSKAFAWDGSYDLIGNYTIHCTDGDLKKPQIPEED